MEPIAPDRRRFLTRLGWGVGALVTTRSLLYGETWARADAPSPGLAFRPDVEVSLKAARARAQILSGDTTDVWSLQGQVLRGDRRALESSPNAALGMDSHPIHLHGYRFETTGTEGGRIPLGARYAEATVNVPVGSTRDVEWVADAPGDWAFHCHKSHHTMNAMSHDLPNMIGVRQQDLEEKVRRSLPGYMAMGETGMGGHIHGGVENTLPMMTGQGPFGGVEMGGMFTILKVREGITSYEDPGWYKQPERTFARKVS